MQNDGTGNDFLAVKLAGKDGTELWRVLIDGGGVTATPPAQLRWV